MVLPKTAAATEAAEDFAQVFPEHKYQMRRVFLISTALGFVGVIEMFGLLVLAKMWLNLDVTQIQTLVFLKLAVAGHLTLFVALTKRLFLAKPFPAAILLWSAIGTKVLVTLFVAYGLGLVAPISWTTIGIVWLYCIIWVFIEDRVKLCVYRHWEFNAKRHCDFLEKIKMPLQSRVSR